MDAVKSEGAILRTLVATGGPCGGKTTAIPYLQEKLGNIGYYPLIVPEAATLMLANGLTPKEMDLEDFQRSVVKTAIFFEEIMRRSARRVKHPKPILVCDRGIPDCAAYMPPDMYARVLARENIGSLVAARDARYDAVFHLVTAADGAREFYSLATNKSRLETAEEALVKDRATLEAWLGHTHLRAIDNSTDFEGKLKRLWREVCLFLGIPVPLEIERAFLVKLRGNMEIPYQDIDIEQFYIMPPTDSGEEEARMRRRGQYGEYLYYRTSKRAISVGKRAETERRASEEEYLLARGYRLPNTRVIRKRRRCFMYQNQYFELDFFIDPLPGLMRLEIELTEEQATISLPPFIDVIEEVTGKPQFSNFAIAHGA